SIHGGDIFDPSKSYSPHKTVGLKQTVRKMLKRADRVVAQSSDTKNNAKTIYSVDRDIDIVPLGISPNPYDIVTRERLSLPSNRFIFSTIGRLVRRKNLEDLLHVVHELGETLPALLLIMGDGPEKSNIEKKVSELRLHDKVMLMGRVSDKEKFQHLAASDVYVSTAIHEGFGIVFLEAMECGLPVVCYDRGGQVDFLESGITGFLVPLGKRDTFRERLIELFHNGNLR
ncbi:MAG: glycosyltransferase, partial [Deltaproteobacteria bacterium]|nr:glycosyltransferase [Deltaproteobacteria bacterium]